MGVLCFGSFARLLKDATGLTNENLVNLLFGGVVPTKGGYQTPLGSPDQSKLINSKFEVPLYIKDPAATPAVIDSMQAYFRNSVIPQIKTTKANSLLSLLIGLVNGDGTIPAADKSAFISKADAVQLPAFLSSVYLYALQQSNNLSADPLPPPASTDSVITFYGGNLYLNGELIKMPDKLMPPASLEESEATYIAELLFAYAEAEGVAAFSPDAVPTKYRADFNLQRQSYFSAEAVRRRVRDVFPPDHDEFEVLKNDTFDGIISVHAQPCANGYERLLKVLAHATLLPKGKSLLETQLAWIGSNEKKGVCHILVNDKRIKWVVE